MRFIRSWRRLPAKERMKTVTVHRGARDGYQVARALEEAGLLEKLVTDLYWPADRGWAQTMERLAPRKALGSLRSRYADRLPSGAVESRWLSGLLSLLTHKAGWVPFSFQSGAIRWCDEDLGRQAGRIATEQSAALLSYSYYGHSAFSNFQGNQPRVLFQLHPHPATVRAILRDERELNPECASSLDTEWELVLPDSDFERLVEEVAMAQHWIVASNFTKETLVANQIPADRIRVIPYGIELDSFPCKRHATRSGSPLRLLFVGTLGQRKGIKYLLEALALLPAGSVELTACGRPVDDLSLFHNSPLPVRLFPNISRQGLREAYQAADVFVFPSLAEGFGHVLLEAMASGLPIISTTRTAAPELIRDGREGFLIGPGSAAEIAAGIQRFVAQPELACTMGAAARKRAEYFTWARFRKEIAEFMKEVLAGEASSTAVPTPCLLG